MSYESLLFYGMAALAVVPGIMILMSRDIVRAAFWLMASLLGVAGLYLFLGADFLGFTQVLVYVGGILILIIFGLMVTNKEKISLHQVTRGRLLVPALITGVVTGGALFYVVTRTNWQPAAAEEMKPTSAQIGYHLMSDFVLPFEVASIVLLVGLVGGVYIARRKGPEA